MNPRPATYKDAALTAELRASASRAGGNRTHTVRIKSPPCCLLHHDPQRRSGVCVSIDVAATSRAPAFLFPVVVLRIELSTTRVSAVSGPPALDYRFQPGTPESNREPPAPKTGVLPSAPLPECFQSERQDSNLRSLGPSARTASASGLGGARTLVCGFSGHR